MSQLSPEESQKSPARAWGLSLCVLALLVAFTLGDIATGSVNVPLSAVVSILLGEEVAEESWPTIVLIFRLPKALTAVLAGAALAVSGLLMQTLFRNPLASPGVLGINAGASLGVAIVILGVGPAGSRFVSDLGLLGNLGLAVAGCTGALFALLVVLMVATRVESIMTLLILGLMFSYITNELVSLLLYFSLPSQVQAYVSWTFGDFGDVTWNQLYVLASLVAVVGGLTSFASKPLNAMLLGEDYARALGVNVTLLRIQMIGATAILSGAVTAFCGPIAFLGVAVPHLCRAILGTSDHKRLLPNTILMGAALAVLADLIAQLPGSSWTLPINTVTALFGAPVVIWVVLRRRSKTFL